MITHVENGGRAKFELRPRRGVYIESPEPASDDLSLLEDFDLGYRTLCAVLYNYVPTSGHPGGSISSGRIISGVLFDGADYDLADPAARGADMLCYAGGHKALGLYAMWGLRDEMARIARPELLAEGKRRLLLTDLLGFRKNPMEKTPLVKKYKSKFLDGHPTPIVPFVSVATGASGVGMGAAVGLALAAKDLYGADAPRMHVVDGEGGITPGRVGEALACAVSAGLDNLIVHLDWNQSSIDSDRVCGEGDKPGDYVPWDPREFFQLYDWNVLFVPNGHDMKAVYGAQRRALALRNGQPTAIVYRTTKGWRYGIEGRASHGSGHAFASEGYHKSLAAFEERFKVRLPAFTGEKTPENVEKVFFETLMVIRAAFESRPEIARAVAGRTAAAQSRFKARAFTPRPEAPSLEAVYAALDPAKPPKECDFALGKAASPRGALGDALGHLNRLSRGAVLGASADLAGSTNLANINTGFPKGFYHAVNNPGSRIAAVGGICEDGMGAIISGVSAYGAHLGVSSSYAAFIASLEHVAARLYGIGQQARRMVDGKPFHTWVMVNAHAGSKTGEDGPTHADPQALQLLQDNFPRGISITLTPWDPQEVWPLVCAGLKARPALLCPFVVRPNDIVPDRKAEGLPSVTASVKGVVPVRRVKGKATVVLQGSGVVSLFMRDVLKKIDAKKLPVNVFYVTSTELFDLLSPREQEKLFPAELRRHAMGITDFTLPTLGRWILSEQGRRASLYPFKHGLYLSSGVWERVAEEGGIDSASQWKAILAWSKTGAKVKA
ncbi:MAG: hypothetical protein WCU88_06520 [Elusimicrobiota bacterium]|jgi:transketolase